MTSLTHHDPLETHPWSVESAPTLSQVPISTRDRGKASVPRGPNSGTWSSGFYTVTPLYFWGAGRGGARTAWLEGPELPDWGSSPGPSSQAQSPDAGPLRGSRGVPASPRKVARPPRSVPARHTMRNPPHSRPEKTQDREVSPHHLISSSDENGDGSGVLTLLDDQHLVFGGSK